jgi:hypothetical protein
LLASGDVGEYAPTTGDALSLRGEIPILEASFSIPVNVRI